MYEELGRLIEGRASDELSDALMALDATLVKAGFNMHREELNLLLSMESTIEGGAILQSVVEILKIAGDKVLAAMEVEVTEDIPLPMLTSLIATLAFYEPSDNDDAIDAVIKLGESSDETLREILGMVTEFDSEAYLPYIAAVSDNLIKKIESIIAEADQFKVESSLPANPEVAKRIELARQKIESDFTKEVEEAGVPSGVSMETLYNHYTEHLLNTSLETAVKDLVYLAMISNLSTEAIVDETAFFIEDLYPSLEQNQKAIVLLRKELASLESILHQGE